MLTNNLFLVIFFMLNPFQIHITVSIWEQGKHLNFFFFSCGGTSRQAGTITFCLLFTHTSPAGDAKSSNGALNGQNTCGLVLFCFLMTTELSNTYPKLVIHSGIAWSTICMEIMFCFVFLILHHDIS